MKELQTMKNVKEEMSDSFPIADSPEKEQTQHSYPCYLSTFQAECVLEFIKQIKTQDRNDIKEVLLEKIDKKSKSTFYIEYVGEVTLERPVVYSQDIQAIIQETLSDNKKE